jgi:hypothetical protein
MAIPLCSLKRAGAGLLLMALAITLLVACSNRPALAAKATVETFYTAVQADNLPVAEDNIATNATPQFHQRVEQAAGAAQAGGGAQKSVQVVQVDAPSIDDGTAHVRVLFADGQSDTVSLVREGLRWKVLTSGRLG